MDYREEEEVPTKGRKYYVRNTDLFHKRPRGRERWGTLQKILYGTARGITRMRKRNKNSFQSK